MDPESNAGYSPWRFASAKGGTFSGGWFPTTPPAWRVGNEIRAPDTLVEASPTRSRTWVRFPPSPSVPEKPLNRAAFRLEGRAPWGLTPNGTSTELRLLPALGRSRRRCAQAPRWGGG